jgi:hypothetical protein
MAMMRHYIVKATHGTDAGIWICEASGILISPFLFIQAVCPARFPRSVTVRRQPSDSPPKFFSKSEEFSFIYGELGRLPAWQSYLHLFSIAIPAVRPFERESSLSDWQFPAPMAGAVVTFDRRNDEDAAGRLVRGLQGLFKPSAQFKNRTLEWVKAQGIPFVVAALGYDADGFAEDQFRQRFGIPPRSPIVTGPALADEALRDAASPGNRNIVAWPIWGKRKVKFAPEYGRQVLGVLCKLIEAHESPEKEDPL